MSASTSLNTGVPARDIGYGMPQYLYKEVAYNTKNIDTADSVIIGVLPAGAILTECLVRVTEAFNASTNALTAGSSSGSNADVVAGGDVDETATGTTSVTRGLAVVFSSETTIYAKYAQTGTAATAGAARFVLTYIVPSHG